MSDIQNAEVFEEDENQIEASIVNDVLIIPAYEMGD
jgi:hypothetical protein